MRVPTPVPAFLLTLALVAEPALAREGEAGDADPAVLRDLDAVVHACEGSWGSRVSLLGRSPNAAVAALLRHGEPAVRAALQHAWGLASRWGTRANREGDALRVAVDLLYPRPPRPDRPPWRVHRDETGVVLWAPLHGGGSGPLPEPGPWSDAFDDVVRGRAFAPPPPESAEVLFEVARRVLPESGEWRGDYPRDDMAGPGLSVALALGEACSADDADAGRLLRWCEGRPLDPAAVMAAGACARPEAEAWLRGVLARAAAEEEPHEGPLRPESLLLEWTAHALARHGDEALADAVDALPAEAADRVLRAAPAAVAAARWRTDRARATDDAAIRRADLLLLETFVSTADARHFAPRDALPALLTLEARFRAAGDDDGANRVRALTSVVLDPWPTVADGGAGTGESRRPPPRWYGPFPTAAVAWRALEEECAAGRLRLLAARPGYADPDPPDALPPRTRAVTDHPPPDPAWDWSTKGSPVHVSAFRTEAGVTVRIRNIGSHAWALSPAALRVVRAVAQQGLTLDPGGLYAGAQHGLGVDAASLVRLEPGSSWDWCLPADLPGWTAIRLGGPVTMFAPDADPGIPVLRSFGGAFVRIEPR